MPSPVGNRGDKAARCSLHNMGMGPGGRVLVAQSEVPGVGALPLQEAEEQPVPLFMLIGWEHMATWATGRRSAARPGHRPCMHLTDQRTRGATGQSDRAQMVKQVLSRGRRSRSLPVGLHAFCVVPSFSPPSYPTKQRTTRAWGD